MELTCLGDPHEDRDKYYSPFSAIDNPTSIQLYKSLEVDNSYTTALTNILSAINVCAKYVTSFITLTQFDVSAK